MNEFTAVDDEILDGIRTILWADAWANHVEECGCQSLSGCEITAVMPPIPQEATERAREIAAYVTEKHGMTLAEMYAKRVQDEQDETGVRNEGTPERFGQCIAWETMGAGVSWGDDHHDWPALMRYVHVDNCDLLMLAIEQCGCMDLVVHVGSRDEYSDPDGNLYSEWAPGRQGTVMLDVYAKNYRHANAWANTCRSIDGSSWETARDLDGLVYTITGDRPGLIDNLRAEGYTLDLTEYTPSPDCE